MAGRARGGAPTGCPSCGQSVLRQLVGMSTGLNVTADVEPLTSDQAAKLSEPDRLAWCLARLRSGALELRWRCRTSAPCGHDLVIEHRCSSTVALYGRRPEGALW